jgi:hypothetical protein
LVGYLVGGAFLDLAYFDLPYYIMGLVVLTYRWVLSRAWETETPPKPVLWRRWMGIVGPASARTGPPIARPLAVSAGLERPVVHK